eukprot:TRINITY_DN1403_c2_g2_i1.p3 TRINITY_DN1403_c2_g2~~TRINITY_DN1403_c2_g2_i1.p3  ORF type:complete len:124 (-),score=0.60 TRINITY_DN1403_c2_g2_i1:1861-2232(-)
MGRINLERDGTNPLPKGNIIRPDRTGSGETPCCCCCLRVLCPGDTLQRSTRHEADGRTAKAGRATAEPSRTNGTPHHHTTPLEAGVKWPGRLSVHAGRGGMSDPFQREGGVHRTLHVVHIEGG